VDAAVVRMTVTRLLQLDPPGTGIVDFPLPAWPLPEAARTSTPCAARNR